jgi:hypothetical protein
MKIIKICFKQKGEMGEGEGKLLIKIQQKWGCEGGVSLKIIMLEGESVDESLKGLSVVISLVHVVL